MKNRHSYLPIRLAMHAAMLAALGLLAGCASPPGEAMPLARYQPDVQGRSPWKWAKRLPRPAAPEPGVASTQAFASVQQVRIPATNQLVVVSIIPPAVPAAEEPADIDLPPALPDGVSAVTGAEALKPLHSGDRISVYLTGIPQPVEIRDIVIDGNGKINLPYVGSFSVEGKTASAAETLVEKLYVERGIFNRITVIVVPQPGEFYVLGEVKHEGRYVISGEITLLQAIAQAGGFTEFKNEKGIKITRGQENTEYDVRRIKSLKIEDPVIRDGDMITVPRKRFW